MSLFNWFGKKKADTPPQTAPRTSSGLAQLDATVPITPAARAAVAPPVGTRKQERQVMRELLYTVIRESMNKMGVLSASYKFKVLSLDSRGRQYLVMMDVQRLQTGEVGRMAQIETLIAQTAKARHDILVTSVYWRVSDQLSAPPHSQSRSTNTTAPEVAGIKPPFEPIDADEVYAFKKALAAVPRSSPTQPGELLHSGSMVPASDSSGFAQTEVDERAAPLSATQYGDL